MFKTLECLWEVLPPRSYIRRYNSVISTHKSDTKLLYYRYYFLDMVWLQYTKMRSLSPGFVVRLALGVLLFVNVGSTSGSVGPAHDTIFSAKENFVPASHLVCSRPTTTYDDGPTTNVASVAGFHFGPHYSFLRTSWASASVRPGHPLRFLFIVKFFLATSWRHFVASDTCPVWCPSAT